MEDIFTEVQPVATFHYGEYVISLLVIPGLMAIQAVNQALDIAEEQGIRVELL